jgi:acetyl coenzyme A synthetase (ADP forming)-like protein
MPSFRNNLEKRVWKQKKTVKKRGKEIISSARDKLVDIKDMMRHGIDFFFNPKTVAIIGASRYPRKFGRVVFENFIGSDFRGKVYPINPNADKILGEKCYPNIKDVPDDIELVVIALPAKLVVETVKQCIEKGVKAAIILSAGFGEIGNKQAEEEILRLTEGKMRIIGPNVIGIYDTNSHVDTVFNPRYRQERPKKGKIAFVSQSGAFGAAMLDWAAFQGVGISKFISIGNRIDVDEVDLLEYLSHDSQTKSIALYIEGTKNGRHLYEKLKQVTRKKPVIVVKAGKTAEGRKAVSSHTGSMAGESDIYSGMFKQAGALEVSGLEELFDFAKALAYQPLPKHSRIQVITNGGGFGVMTTDAIVKNGLKLAQPSEKTLEKIRNSVPAYASVSNPMDLVGDADSQRYRIALENTLQDKNVDGVIVILLMQISALESDIVDVLIDMNDRFKKPLLVCSTGGEFTNIHTKMMEKEGIPTYPTPERAVKAMKALVNYSRIKRGHKLFI